MSATSSSTARSQVRRLAVLLAAVTLAAMTVLVTSGVQPAASDEPPPPPVPAPIVGETLARMPFKDDVDAKFKVTLASAQQHPAHHGRQTSARTHVAQTRDASEIVMMRITVQPGARFPWHTHFGPVIVAVEQGRLTYVEAHDCSERTYAEEAFVDPGGGHVHSAYNPGPGEAVLYATFFGVEPGRPPTIPATDIPADHCT